MQIRSDTSARSRVQFQNLFFSNDNAAEFVPGPAPVFRHYLLWVNVVLLYDLYLVPFHPILWVARLCEVTIYSFLLEPLLQLLTVLPRCFEGHAPIRRPCGTMASHPGLLNLANVHHPGTAL